MKRRRTPGRSEIVAARPISLDEAAARLVALEPSDADGIRELQQALGQYAASADCPASARSSVIAAQLRLGDIGGANPSEVLEDAAEFIERAMALRDGVELPPSPPAPEEDDDVMLLDEAPHARDVDVIADDADLSLMRDFVAESRDYLEQAESALLTLESRPGDVEAVNTIFRAFHTIKGTSAFLGLSLLTSLAHHAETLLSRVRDKEIRCVGGYADLSLASIDVMREIVVAVGEAIIGDKRIVAPSRYAELFRTLENPEKAGINEGASPAARRLTPRGVGIIHTDAPPPSGAPRAVAPVALPASIVPSEAPSAGDEPTRATKKSGGDGESSMRVRTERLDRLVDLVGELVIAQAMVAQDGTLNSGEHAELHRKVAHAGKIVRELQDLSMSMRMVPLRATFQKMARLVRDVAHKTEKLVDLVVTGDETEIDRTMVDAIADPLVHMVRNAVDHGIERPDVRSSCGKARNGTVRLSAYHAGGNVVVELSDDGKGLDREKILRTAIERGLVESGKGMSESDIFALIFAPGFSTNTEVTDLSGRGVGMDVVRRSIEGLRGRVEIASEPGKGSTFRLWLPLTLAITDGMLVRVADERFIIPTMSIQVTFRPQDAALSTVAGRGELVMLRDELLPVLRLHHLLGVSGAIEDPTEGLLVVVESGDRRFALLVDELLGQQQVVAKSLGEQLGRIAGVSGGAILGDGRVGLILDIAELVALSRKLPAPMLTPAGVAA